MFRNDNVSEPLTDDFTRRLLPQTQTQITQVEKYTTTNWCEPTLQTWCGPKDAEVFSRLGLSTSLPTSQYISGSTNETIHDHCIPCKPPPTYYSSTCASTTDIKERKKKDKSNSITTTETADNAASSPASIPINKSLSGDTNCNATEFAFQAQGENISRSNTEPSGYFKLLVSQIVAGSIIGRQGAEITAVQEKCSVRIKLSGNKDFYPGTHDRVVHLKGSLLGVTRAMRIIIARLKDEAVTTALSFGKNPQPADEITFNLKMIIPKTSVGVLIGKSGFQVKEIQRITGATILILKEVHGAPPAKERVALITGTEQTVEAAACILVVMLFKCNSTSLGSLPELDAANFDWEALKASTGQQSDQLLMPQSNLEICQVNRAEVLDNLLWALSKRDISEFVTCVDMQMPTSAVGMIIGTGGRSINEIQTKSGTRIQVSAKDDLIPGTTNRKLTVTGTVAGIFNALCQVVQRLSDQSATLPPPKPIDPQSEPECTSSRACMQASQTEDKSCINFNEDIFAHSLLTSNKLTCTNSNSTFPMCYVEENNSGMADIIQAAQNRRCLMMFSPMTNINIQPRNDTSGDNLKIINSASWAAPTFGNGADTDL